MLSRPPIARLGILAAALVVASFGAGRAAGESINDLRKLESRHLELVTDVPTAPAVDELPAVFEAALPLWAEYFDVEGATFSGKRWQAYLVGNRSTFADRDLLPAERPDFVNGYAHNERMWLVDQPNDYYRRHLFLHEGTHAFMRTQLGGCGAGWYMEGIAELMGTHRWEGGKLRMAVFPRSREEAPMWGRIKLLRESCKAEGVWPIERVMALDGSEILTTTEYAWAWAFCALLENHSKYQSRFRKLKDFVNDERFNDRFRQLIGDDWSDLEAEWEAYVAAIDYGYDFNRMAMVHRQPKLATDQPLRVEIDADRGWQSTGWALAAGRSYRITASGRYTIAKDPKDGTPWPCEPGGVTIEYREGAPLGTLLGALQPVKKTPNALSPGLRPGVSSNQNSGASTPGQSPGLNDRDPSFAHPMLIGLDATITPKAASILYVRVNDAAAKLGDNAGWLQVHIEPARDHQ